MRIIFMGTPSFAVPALEAIAEAHDVIAVYSRPDSKSGRGNKLHPSKVKEAATELGIGVHTPRSLRDPEVVAEIAALKPDAIVVAAYGVILPREVLVIPPYGCLNIHGSLLPRWRGSAPIQRAILDGDDIAGICIMQMEEGLDTGAYHICDSVEIGSKNTSELTEQLAYVGAEGILEALAGLEDNTYQWVEQDPALVTYADKIDKDETLLRPGLTGHEFLRRVQASSHRAPARCVVCGKRVTIIAAHPADEVIDRGAVELTKKRIVLGCKGRAVELDRVKPEGKREMSAASWIAGLHPEELSWQVLPEMYHKLPQ